MNHILASYAMIALEVFWGFSFQIALSLSSYNDVEPLYTSFPRNDPQGLIRKPSLLKALGSRDGTVVRALASHPGPPPMWPGFDSRTRRHMWVEFVVGCSEKFFLRVPRFSPLLKKPTFLSLKKVVFFLQSTPDNSNPR